MAESSWRGMFGMPPGTGEAFGDPLHRHEG